MAFNAKKFKEIMHDISEDIIITVYPLRRVQFHSHKPVRLSLLSNARTHPCNAQTATR
jgi:hypothetical protein